MSVFVKNVSFQIIYFKIRFKWISAEVVMCQLSYSNRKTIGGHKNFRVISLSWDWNMNVRNFFSKNCLCLMVISKFSFQIIGFKIIRITLKSPREIGDRRCVMYSHSLKNWTNLRQDTMVSVFKTTL